MSNPMDHFDDLGYGNSSPSNNFEMGSPTLQGPQDPEEQQRQQRFREKEENRVRDLQKKQVEEIEAKNERKAKAKQTLQDMMKNQDTLKKGSSSKSKDDESNQNGAGGSWTTVKNNIALKNGDFPGNKDISRMRDAIVNRAEDESK